ncbi:MAG: hypothetical protein KJ732_00305, partial [Candidatus Margulisbacteria bacterium]|nr:hypothetical protein [Candidatus Margulisiibacteriota bacterium]
MASIRFALFLAIVFTAACLPVEAKGPSTLSKKINQLELSVSAPEHFDSDGKRIFIDSKQQLGVDLKYGGLKVRANQASYDLEHDVIELSYGFKGQLEQFSIEGDYFRINPWTGNYAGEDLKFGYLVAYLRGKRFQFYGKKISVDDISASPFYYPVFSSNSGRLDIYPGYSLAHRNTLKLFNLPFYYVPLYFNDWRRKYYELPFPALQAGKNIFRGTYGLVHSHYFVDPGIFGDISLHFSSENGAGAQLQQIVRLSDWQQLELKYLAWEKAEPRTRLSYTLQLFADPRDKTKELSFNEQRGLEGRIATIEPEVSFTADYSLNQELNRSIIDRYPDFSVLIRMHGFLYDHAYAVAPSASFGRIKEKKIYPENAPSQAVDRVYDRIKFGVDFSYFLETQFIRPFVQKAFWDINYEHADYLPGNANRGRVSSSLKVRRPILLAAGLFYEAVLTKGLLDYGQSPFFFEEYGWLRDSASFDLYLQSDDILAGSQWIHDFSIGQIYNEIYYFGLKALDSSYAVIKFDRRQESWEFAFVVKEAS